jgi:ABC-type hemin transport system substrate-binding protein
LRDKLTSTAFLLRQNPVEVFSFKGFLYFYNMILKSPAGLTHPASRIISLVPSQTELLYYLGLEKEVVGITKFCIHPAHWYRNKIRVGGTKTIDNQILMSLSPDLIIANKEENMRSHIEALAADFPVWVTDVNNLEDALQMILDVG